MAAGLTGQILEAHRPPRGGGRGATERRLAPDHVLLDGLAGRIALASLAGLGARARRVVALACLEEGAFAASHADAGTFGEGARRAGCHVAPPGRSECDLAYRERFAAPGKLAFATGGGAPSAGALGTLVLAVDALEAAAAFAGVSLVVPDPDVVGVLLEGALLPGVGGADVALAIAPRMPERASTPVLEFGGPGISDLSMFARLDIASQVGGIGGRAALFASDERTRQALAAERREADWKPLESLGGERPEKVIRLDLETIEPLMAPDEDPRGARPVRHAMGMPIARVLVGAQATLADLARLAALLGGRRVHSATEVVWVPGSARVLQTAEASGVTSALTEAGVRVSLGGLPPDVGASSSPIAAGLFTASRGEQRAGRRTAWSLASLETCAAAALAGALVDPRELERLAPGATHVAPEPVRLLEPTPDPEGGAADGVARVWAGAPLDRPLRGSVLIGCGDHVGADRVLPLGARQEKLLQDPGALAEFAFAPLDPGFAARARRHGGGVVVAGRELGGGEPGELAALVLAALGVRVVLARSFAPEFVRRLTHAGVLAAEFRHQRDERDVEVGDELEIPGLPGALEPAKPLTVRNLTRGAQYAVAHRLDARAIEWLREGGLLAAARAGQAH